MYVDPACPLRVSFGNMVSYVLQSAVDLDCCRCALYRLNRSSSGLTQCPGLFPVTNAIRVPSPINRGAKYGRKAGTAVCQRAPPAAGYSSDTMPGGAGPTRAVAIQVSMGEGRKGTSGGERDYLTLRRSCNAACGTPAAPG